MNQSIVNKSGTRKNVSEESVYADKQDEVVDSEIKQQELTVDNEINEPVIQSGHEVLGEATRSDYIVMDDDDYFLEPSCD